MWHLRGSRILVTPSSPSNLSDQGFVKRTVTNSFHHGQMLEIIVRLEQCVAGEELDQNTTDTPDVAREAPAKVQNNLGRPVVSCRDNR